MRARRRTFLKWSAAAGASAAAALTDGVVAAQGGTERPGGQAGGALPADVPAPIRALRPMTAGIVPISHTRDTAGPMARNVADCVLLDGIVTGGASEVAPARCGSRVHME